MFSTKALKFSAQIVLLLIGVSCSASPGPSIRGLYLVNADTKERISELSENSQISLKDLRAKNVSVIADVEGNPTEVTFSVNKIKRFRVESSPPFTLTAETKNHLKPWPVKPGLYTITAIARQAKEIGQPFSSTIVFTDFLSTHQTPSRSKSPSPKDSSAELAEVPAIDQTNSDSMSEVVNESPTPIATQEPVATSQPVEEQKASLNLSEPSLNNSYFEEEQRREKMKRHFSKQKRHARFVKAAANRDQNLKKDLVSNKNNLPKK